MQTQPDTTPHSWKVLKFGGSSLATPERWDRIGRILSHNLAEGARPLVVLSAVGGTTDDLERLLEGPAAERDRVLARIRERHVTLADALGVERREAIHRQLDDLADRVSRDVAPGEVAAARHRALVLSQGELLSTRLAEAWMQARDFPVRWFDARTVLTALPVPEAAEAGRYLSAECDYSHSPEMRRSFDEVPENVLLTQGFLAGDADGETYLLGRGGSDTAASYLAAILNAEDLEIWTDVPGLFTANPRTVPEARLIRRLGYDEAETLASMGAAALHPRSLRPVREAGIPMRIGWTDHPELQGTWIVSEDPETHVPGVKAISSRRGLFLLSTRRDAEWQPVGFMADVAECFRRHHLPMDLLSSSPSDIRATIDLAANPDAEDRLADLLRDLRHVSETRHRRNVGSVSLVGREIRDVLPRVAETLRHLDGHDIHLVTQAANNHSLTYVTDEESVDDLVSRIHADLFRDGNGTGTFGPTWTELQAQVTDLPRAGRAAEKVSA